MVGHRPVCSCPSGSHNINNSCTSDTSCQWDDRRYDSGEHYYDDNCEHRCECYNGEFICQPTTCQAGLKPKGQLTKEVKLLRRTKWKYKSQLFRAYIYQKLFIQRKIYFLELVLQNWNDYIKESTLIKQFIDLLYKIPSHVTTINRKRKMISFHSFYE